CPPYEIGLRSGQASPPLLLAARGTPASTLLPEVRGAERRQALARNAVPVARLAIGPVSLAKETNRPMTPAGAPLGAPPRHFSDLGPRFIGPAHGPASASSSQPAHNGRQAGPEAARVLGCEPSPQAPHPAPPARRLRKAPLASEAVGNIPNLGKYSKRNIFTIS